MQQNSAPQKLTSWSAQNVPVAWRVLLFVCITLSSGYLLSQYLSSRSEVFWVLFAPLAWFGSSTLRLFPSPQFNAKTQPGRIASIAVLILFPIGFYGFLVYATGSPWSWTEMIVSILFFAVALETLLLYLMQGYDNLVTFLASRCNPRWKIPLTVATRCVLYSGLFPFLFVILAVHRPKLLPRILDEIPAQHQEQVDFLSRDNVTRIRGIFIKPAISQGTVLICHGVGANHSDIASIISILYNSGYQVLAFDFRGHGNSDGHTITYGWAERDDVLAAYDFCLNRPDVDPDSLFAFGVSMGGATLIESLPEMPKVRAAVIDSAFASLGDMAEHQFRLLPRFARIPFRQIVRILAWAETGADIERIRPIDSIQKTTIPLLIIHGSNDQIIPAAHAKQLTAARKDRTTLHIEPESPHIGMALLNPTEYTRMVRRHFAIEPSANPVTKMNSR